MKTKPFEARALPLPVAGDGLPIPCFACGLRESHDLGACMVAQRARAALAALDNTRSELARLRAKIDAMLAERALLRGERDEALATLEKLRVDNDCATFTRNAALADLAESRRCKHCGDALANECADCGPRDVEKARESDRATFYTPRDVGKVLARSGEGPAIYTWERVRASRRNGWCWGAVFGAGATVLPGAIWGALRVLGVL